jgi:hypothetical protein
MSAEKKQGEVSVKVGDLEVEYRPAEKGGLWINIATDARFRVDVGDVDALTLALQAVASHLREAEAKPKKEIPASIADILSPEWEGLLVLREPQSMVVGVGLEGKGIIRPDTSRDAIRPRIGKVIKWGPDAPPFYRRKGLRVLFAPMSGTVLGTVGGTGKDEEGRDIVLLPPAEVLCVMSGVENVDDPLSLNWVDHAIPPPGHLLVERAEKPLLRGRIIIPDGSNAATRSAEAEVVGAARDTSRFAEGDGVLLGGGVGRSIPFGLRGERVFYRCTPRQILGRLEGKLTETVTPEESAARHAADIMQPVEAALDEGDPRLPR